MTGGEANYAYAFPYDDGGAKMAGILLQEDYNVALALKGFTNNGREYPPGTLVARVKRNREALHGRVVELAESCGVEVIAVEAGWAEEGISFGSIFMKNLKQSIELVLKLNWEIRKLTYFLHHHRLHWPWQKKYLK